MNCKITTINVVFYVWVCALLAYELLSPIGRDILLVFDAINGFNTTAIAVLLIYSLRTFKAQVKAMKKSDFYATEMLMSVHLAIFLTYILSYFGALVSGFFQYTATDNQNSVRACRSWITKEAFIDLCTLSSFAMLSLFTYLSVLFCEPI